NRRGVTGRRETRVPQDGAVVLVEGAESLVAARADEDQAARGHERPTVGLGAGWWTPIARQCGPVAEGHLPQVRAGVQIDRVQGCPRRLAGRALLLVENAVVPGEDPLGLRRRVGSSLRLRVGLIGAIQIREERIALSQG